ncbi:MAG TPA: DNA polymerase III subunit gamma/tau [Thermomicrobiales bacterium]|nr:DNA polymerase III subunit gamma/tau [Thermomicrobiales bacterium]
MSAPMFFEPPDASAPAAPPAAAPAEPTSLYRKYRPQSFDDRELVGQEHVVRTLRNAIRLDRVAHAYLFCGPRGSGKTTTARVLAKAVNCLDPDPERRPCNACANCLAIARGATTDVVEIDAASNRGIDDIRDLRERVKYAPSQLKVKFYIVDEAHQITGAAANAFLKTLEEPPAHTRFILATTDPEELLPTIVSRCQRFDFRRIGADAMIGRLRTVADRESIAIADDALAVIARHATGSLRDALGLLDQLALHDADRPAGDGGAAPIDAAAVRAMLGLSRNDRVEALVAALAAADATAALSGVNQAVEQGDDPRQLNRQLVAYLRQLLVHRAGAPADVDERAAALAGKFELSALAELARRFSDIDYRIKHAPYGQLPLEIALVEACLATQPASAPSVPPAARAIEESSAAPSASRPRATAPERPVTSLRDRVRGVAAVPAGGNAASPPPTPTPTPIRSAPAASDANAATTVDQLADLWPRVRQDVKAINRRIEALLSSVDPAFVVGAQVTLATPYPFHRDKLNADEVRAVVEQAISRLLGSAVAVSTILRDDVERLRPASPNGSDDDPPAAPAARPAPPPESEPPPPSTAEPNAIDAQRLQAAKNIFDADEIDPAESG